MLGVAAMLDCYDCNAVGKVQAEAVVVVVVADDSTTSADADADVDVDVDVEAVEMETHCYTQLLACAAVHSNEEHLCTYYAAAAAVLDTRIRT